ncbi:13442_t:CDS:2, partial [Entrophospora sp. SA101]
NESQLCSPHYLQNLLDNLNNQNTILIDVSLNDIYVNITDDSITMSNDDFIH